jgi:hypothetical protein
LPLSFSENLSGFPAWRVSGQNRPLVERRQSVFSITDNLAQDNIDPRLLGKPQGRPKPDDPRAEPVGFVLKCRSLGCHFGTE